MDGGEIIRINGCFLVKRRWDAVIKVNDTTDGFFGVGREWWGGEEKMPVRVLKGGMLSNVSTHFLEAEGIPVRGIGSTEQGLKHLWLFPAIERLNAQSW